SFTAARQIKVESLSVERLLLACLIVGVVLFCGSTIAAHSNRIFDNSFITYRYARNLADGAGITWNVNEPPVEGYTNFLLVIILAPFIRLGFDPLWVTRLFSQAAGVGLAYLLYRVASTRYAAGPSVAFTVGLSFLLASKTALLTMIGLETVIYSF